MNKPSRRQVLISVLFFLISLCMVYRTYYSQLRIAWQPTPLSAIYIFSMIFLAVLPTAAYIFIRKPGDTFVVLCVIASFLMSFVGTFVFFVYLYIIYILDLTLLIGQEYIEKGRRASLSA